MSMITPILLGRLETVGQLIPPERRERYAADLNARRVRYLIPDRQVERLVWVGDYPLWFCPSCEVLLEAPTGRAFPGMGDETHRNRCFRQKPPALRRVRAWVKVIARKGGIPGRVWDAAEAVGGEVPLQFPRVLETGRADERWFEVWVAADKVRELERQPGVRGVYVDEE